jgi:predicted DNA-binding transcriptional regulator YafY
MPVNRNALLRYQVIDKCLCNKGRKWTWKDILKEINNELENEMIDPIGKTTFFKDILDIEQVYKTTIEKFYGDTKKIIYYRYEDPEFSIRKQPMHEHEIAQFKASIQTLSRFKGLPQFEWLNEMIPMFETKLGLRGSKEENIISFDTNEDYTGLEFITPLFHAISNKRVLTVIYQDFKSPVQYELEFHPYHLKQYNSRWFVFGNDPYKTHLKISNLALDRIKSISEKEAPYKTSDINWEEYFTDIIGVTRNNGEAEEIRILIKDEEQAAYIETKPLHQSQKRIKKTELGYETSIKAVPNYELKKLLLSFGERIEVLAPASLRSEVSLVTEKLFSYYHP